MSETYDLAILGRQVTMSAACRPDEVYVLSLAEDDEGRPYVLDAAKIVVSGT